MTKENYELSQFELGERLRSARETANLTQDVAAKAAGLSRTTLVAIEKGHRAAKLMELQDLCRSYGVSVNSILRRESVHVDLVPRFRTLAETGEPCIDTAARLLNDLVKAEVELENILGVQKTYNYPAEKSILAGDVRQQAEQDALNLRNWLGLGDGPIRDLYVILELQLGIRVYTRKLDGKVSGLFAYDDAVGACMLINSTHRRDRRNQTGSHELGHFIATRRRPEIYQDEMYDNSREERYANAFARAFMTPTRTVMEKFKEVTIGSSHLTRRHIILLANFFSVSRQAMVMRLEELGLTKKGTWDWFQDNGGITDEQVRQVLGEDGNEFPAVQPQQSSRLYLLAIEAWKRDLLSEGQMSDLLKLSREMVRELLDEAQEDEVDDLFKLPN
ncbi:MAG: ImmA/IrrE family metallo-endopeptidase [Aquabacterium sp.]|jgi:Zn-dependent peptidase ImmA (M78 family)|uniref:ImmA/IrrE family metallo-endopeptidase n=1 Tax=Aquabacterium olei TaxID=1296669 RepID=A0A2U8FR20_9BURK|nr:MULTISPECIES: XRE family transcriptional regulator [Aquabacterium]AWI53505.1 ImmA/IrrE family metallo-endopeptidase [Aquabacterium olei]MBI5924563.1 ImmA/IrrE family metallo-endopeptidase [Aquabacterium sp.]MDE2431696.1 ImmA/IrrE family metallo-endopeptidase [Burkholderiales bacterium]